MAFIALSGGKVAICDPEDKPGLDKFNWTVKICHGVMYAIRRVYKDHGDFTIYMHRQVMLTPKGMVCHHRNKNGLDNRKTNLRNLLKMAANR